METALVQVGGVALFAAFAVTTFWFLGRLQKPKDDKYNPDTGVGRGAPGFTTNVRRVTVPAHISERIRRGENVSAEEITRAIDEAKKKEEEKGAVVDASPAVAEAEAVQKRRRKQKNNKKKK